MSTPHQNCPDEDVLQELAAGLASPELAQQTMKHVEFCGNCAPTLRRFIREFSEEQSPEDLVLLEQLESSQPRWQKRLVRELVRKPKRFLWPRLMASTAGLAVIAFIAVAIPTLVANFNLSKANKGAAAAITERRTSMMRQTGVDYSPHKPFSNEMGPESGRTLDELPSSLHEATGIANKSLQAAKPDPRWLQVMGRALLWEETPSSLEKAEKDFEKARAAGLDSASLEIDLATSYFERDARTEHPSFQRTLNLLNEVLTRPKLTNEERASALFDLAIAYEKTQEWDQAKDTWERYLKLDSSTGWA